MPSFNPFSSMSGRGAAALFDVRLENDFIVFRGGEEESNGQIVKGTVVLCLTTPLKMEDVRLRLTGTMHMNASGSSSQKNDRLKTICEKRWEPFIGVHGKSMILPAGNYEYPFEYLLPGDTAESVEGIPEASITYRLKATVGRGKLAYDLHAYKHLRIIRTLDPSALEFHHAMSVENIWPNKVDYSISIPQKAVVFGGIIDLTMRLTPLLKGLEMGRINIKLVEIRETTVTGATGMSVREHKVERDVSKWDMEVDRATHWVDMIEDTGQDGWVVTKALDLPRRLRQCVQDTNVHGIKIRHKLKLTIALKNPDGHVSELRATLPVAIFISPNAPLNEQGDVINPETAQADGEEERCPPPSYHEHKLDQLYDDDMTGFRTPAGAMSGVNSPFYVHSRAGSSENLSNLMQSGGAIPPADLSSRLMNVSDDPTLRNTVFNSTIGRRSEPSSNNLTRQNSGDDTPSSGRDSPEHIDLNEFAPTTRVPSYHTAVQTRPPNESAPTYQTALTQPRTPPATDNQYEYMPSITTRAEGEEAASNHRSNAISG
ncbi:uncharacterized protein F5Z01DRAFT_621471 [Emericellopsis atlantica]|uniref:Arrestin C-terminal-like domain-containing protein n=1 Tax=Emericellopsis atlantica TaxID=2614577 RepID=A0A9P7ZMD8_9HYPO|nr:uncharacterized protein F5Z01DRAFT_621471 [Emericellopsis atlantica]KAG9254695.1 hypothetical protein F5Z01DRAFT_621471 [Emericellopsis atlantica]